MTKEEFAKMLNGREYREEITRREMELAKESGLVIMFGYSDDNVEIVGCINDEIGAYDGTTIEFALGEIWNNKCEEDKHCPNWKWLNKILKPNVKIVKAIWGEDNISWQFRTDIPHSTFDIMEDGEIFCRGIVFDYKDIC